MHNEPFRMLGVVILIGNNFDAVQMVVGSAVDSPWVSEIVVVDDGSDDGTAEQLRIIEESVAASSRAPSLRVIRNKRTLGKGESLCTGLVDVRKMTSRYILLQDANFEYLPVDHAPYIQPLLAGVADIVCGSRFETGGYIDDCGAQNYLSGKISRMLVNFSTRKKLSDPLTGYRVMRREVAETLVVGEGNDGVWVEMTARTIRDGWRIQEMGIHCDQNVIQRGGRRVDLVVGPVKALLCASRYSVLHKRPRPTR